jgi:hypothetical protein
MKKILGAAVAFLFATALASAWQYGPPSSGPTFGLGKGSSEPKREKPPEFRTLTGAVLDKADAPVKDAVVYLRNRRTKGLTTYIADADGAFRFPNLSRTADYEIYAELKGQKSPVKTLSSFDSRTNAKINLYVGPKEEKKEEQVAKKDEKKEASKEEKKDQPK